MNWFLFVVIIVGLALVAVLRNADEADQPAPIAPAESVELPAAETCTSGTAGCRDCACGIARC